jgi:uncharacterized protein YbjT (DUF2867 family)
MNTSSNAFKTVLVTGGSGFIGSSLVPKLVSRGYHVIIPTRRSSDAKHLQMLPTVEVFQTPMKSADELAGVMARSDAVINLIGILHGRHGKKAAHDLDNDPRYRAAEDPYGPDFGAMHVEFPKSLAELAIAHKVKRMIQVSAYGTHLPRAKLPSMYLRSKAAGEKAVLGLIGLSTTVIRPSVVFGPGDKFLNMFATMQKLPIVIPLARGGCKFQPIYVEDLTSAIANALENGATFGKAYDVLGPETYTLSQLVKLTGRLSGNERPVFALPDVIGKIQASVLEMLPGPTLMSVDNFDSLAIDNAAPSSYVMSPDLGITPHALSVIAPTYLSPNAPRFSIERSRAGR